MVSATRKGKGSLEIEKINTDDGLSAQRLSQQIEKTQSRGCKKSYTLDLGIHSPASLGYFNVNGLDTAPALVRLAKVKGLDVIAITDFFSGSFIDKITEAAKGSSVTVIAGVNLRCRLGECTDVVLTCLFPEGSTRRSIEEFLQALEVPASVHGNSEYVLTIPFERILSTIDTFQGVAFPSRMDKTPQQTHVIPLLVEKYGFRAFDLAYADSSNMFRSRWPGVKFLFFSFSNAKALAQIGSRMVKVKMMQPGFNGIKELVTRADETAN